MDLAWVKNLSPVDQSWGKHTVRANNVGLIPIDVIECYRTNPNPNLLIIADHPDEWVVQRTPHRPWSPLYQGGGTDG